jgi:ribulose-phosphate 3-epimerase
MRRIAPSILAADFADLAAAVEPVARTGILHLDVMDGHFVPNISFGPPVIESLRPRTEAYFDTHLMIADPGRYVDAFADAGADRLTVHAEACDDVETTLEAIHDRGLDAGLALNPDTPVEAATDAFDRADAVVVMSVQPGFGGQSFIEATVGKVETVAGVYDGEIEVDGGIDADTGPKCAAAGADTFVIGSSLFGADDVPARLRALETALGIEG